MTRGRTATVAAWCATLAGALLAGACAQEEKVVRYNPFFGRLSGDGWIASGATQEIGVETMGIPDPVPGDDRIVIELPNGHVRLVSRSVRDLMSHIERTLDEDEFDLFERYILSQKTKDYLASQGQTPRDLFRVMQNSRKAIAKTFGRMPFGERTPSCLFEKAGPRMFVLKLTGLAARDVPYTKLWVSYEGGEYRFVWLS